MATPNTESATSKMPKNRPDSPRIRRKSWPSVPRSILKTRSSASKSGNADAAASGRNSADVVPVTTAEDAESGLGSLSNVEPIPPKEDIIQLAEMVEKQKVIQDEANSANSAATVVSARTTRKRRIAGIFQHYYPEGGWGYVVLICAFLSQFLASGLQLGFLVLIPYAVKRYNASPTETGKVKFHNY